MHVREYGVFTPRLTTVSRLVVWQMQGARVAGDVLTTTAGAKAAQVDGATGTDEKARDQSDQAKAAGTRADAVPPGSTGAQGTPAATGGTSAPGGTGAANSVVVPGVAVRRRPARLVSQSS